MGIKVHQDVLKTPRSCRSLQVAASPPEGCSGGVYVEEVLHHARGERCTQQDPAGGVFPENCEYLLSFPQVDSNNYFPWN